MKIMTPSRNDEGSALVMSLLIVLALSITGASLTVLSLSETYGSMNYRLMSQARYGAESAVHKAANYLLNPYVNVMPGTLADPLAAYTLTASPVTAGGNPVVLSSIPGVPSSYPVGATQAAFQAAAQGSLVTGNANVQYSASATLLSMRQVTVYGSPTPVVVQTWQITGRGVTTGARNAQVEVTTTLERQTMSLFNYAVFATNPGCGALAFSGGAVVDSYDSQNIVMSGGNVVTDQYGGNVGSNGNLNESGNPTSIWGSMSTPRTGVGNCASGGVSAWTVNGNASVSGGLIQLPQALNFPTPDPPNPMPPTNTLGLTKNSTCAGIAGCTVGGTPAGLILAPGEYGNIHLSAQAVIHLTAGTYSVNSLMLTGASEVVIDSGPVIFNMGGTGTTTVVDFTGGTLTNDALNPAWFQVVYAGAGAVNMSGSAKAAGLVYAPNAAVQITGGSDWFGAVVAATFQAAGGMKVHNDRQLANEFMSVGNYMLGQFSWKKY
jgi:hypothetical protein